MLAALLWLQSVDWAKDWDDAAERARDEKKLILVLVELYGGLEIPQQLPILLADENLAHLARERFVCLQWKPGMTAPFQDPKVWGMGSSTFGAALLYVAPDGRIVGQTANSSSVGLDVYSRAVLDRQPEFSGDPIAATLDDLDRAEAHLRRGELDAADKLLAKPDSPRAFGLRATLRRRQRRGDDALADLARAGDQASDFEKGEILARMGKLKEAEAIFEKLDPATSGLWRVMLKLRTDPPAAKPLLEQIVRDQPDTAAGKTAAIALNSGSLDYFADIRFEWPSEGMLDILRDAKPERKPRDEAERGAVEALLKSQQADGSWITPYNLSSRAASFSVAVTSIGATSLLPFRDRKEVAAAVDRARDFVLRELKEKSLSRHGGIFGFSYPMWGRAFALRFLSARGETDAVKSLIEEIAKEQTKNGGWTYFQDQEASFLTAAVVLALREAKAPDDMIAHGVEFLRDQRSAAGRYRYMRSSPATLSEGALRGPLCALAVDDVDEIRAALDIYLECRLESRKERGKALCHTAPDALAAYFLLFGYAFAAESIEKLPEKERARYRDALLDDVLESRLEDGTFLDFPLVGRSYGTGMALRALTSLREK